MVGSTDSSNCRVRTGMVFEGQNSDSSPRRLKHEQAKATEMCIQATNTPTVEMRLLLVGQRR